MKSNHYTHSLYYKLLIGYLIFGLLGFITIATISSEMTYHHLVERESEVLYDEATMIADRCSKAYEGKTINLDSAYPQIEAVSAYLRRYFRAGFPGDAAYRQGILGTRFSAGIQAPFPGDQLADQLFPVCGQSGKMV